MNATLVSFGLLVAAAGHAGTAVPNSELAYYHGRECFVLRSGRVQMVIEANRADVGPAFTYLLFDAQDSRQSARKRDAWNYEDGVRSSALEVVLGGFAFTALGHHTDTRWVNTPAVEATWWAGGVKVTERISSLGGGRFLRRVDLNGDALAGEDTVTLRFSLPRNAKADMRLSMKDSGPIRVGPGLPASVESTLSVNAAAGEPPNWPATSTIKTADRTVQDIYDKARYGLHGMIADDGTMNASLFEYGRQWVRDTSNTALGALHAGHFELARAAIDRLLATMIADDGNAMIAGAFDSPDREQFDQMGELLHLLRSYRDWTGDDVPVRQHRARLLALIERPLHERFRGPNGLVHNRREFWERTLDDAYELAYQTYVILGLREAAALADALDGRERAPAWLAEAARIESAMLATLVEDGHLIKRRNLTGELAVWRDQGGRREDVPARTEKHHKLWPDASAALPIALRIVDPQTSLARKTLDELEALWNARWTSGGYERYHSSTQIDQPGPWTLATAFLLRAQHNARDFTRSRRSLEWMNTHAGGRTGAWFEQVPLVRSQLPYAGILPWASGEIALFAVRHYLGIDFAGGALTIRPALYPGSPPVEADLRYRAGRLRIAISGAGPVRDARVNGKRTKPDSTGAIRLPRDFAGGAVVIRTRNVKGS